MNDPENVNLPIPQSRSTGWLEVRPCLRTLTVSGGVMLTPDAINALACSGKFANWLHRTKLEGREFTATEIYEMAEAISDNWTRFWESC
jgi:hypothetical protein